VSKHKPPLPCTPHQTDKVRNWTLAGIAVASLATGGLAGIAAPVFLGACWYFARKEK